MTSQTSKGPIDKKKAVLYFFIAVFIVILLFPVMIFIHEMGHVIAILLLGGGVKSLNLTWFSGSVSFSGIKGSRDLFLVHLSGVLANTIVGAYLIFHVWKYKDHPFIEALALMWGLILFLIDFLNYTISDMFYDHGGDFNKIYDAYPWAIPIFVLVDAMMVGFIIVLLTRKGFWKGIQLPSKSSELP